MSIYATVYMPGTLIGQTRELQASRNWSFGWCEAPCGCYEPN